MTDWINKKTYCQSNGSDITYFVDNKISNSDEFEIAMEQQGNKTEVTWYDFTEENIETLFSTP